MSCQAELPNIEKGFSEIDKNQSVIGFKVHWNDAKMTSDERKLAEELNITQESTKIIIKNRKQFLIIHEGFYQDDDFSELMDRVL